MILLTFLSDGRMLWNLADQQFRLYDTVVSHVADRDRNMGIVRGWVAASWPLEGDRDHRSASSGDFNAGYLVELAAERSGAPARRPLNDWVLLADFARLFPLPPEDQVEREKVVERFARDLAFKAHLFFTRSQNLARERLAGGAYLPVLEAHLHRLQSVVDAADQSFYETLDQGVGAIMDGEEYLLVSDDPRARQLYLALVQERRHLYNWYMDLAKGGNVRPR